MLNAHFAILAALFPIVFNLGYVADVLKGKAQPDRVTWFLWALAPTIAFLAELSQGVGLQSLLTLAVGVGPLLVLVASFVSRQAYWKITKFDVACATFSLIALFSWLVTGEGNLAILCSIIADLLAAIPTIVKSYRTPETESYSTYLGANIGAIITLLTIKDWTFANYAFPIYIALTMGLIAALIVTPRTRLKWYDPQASNPNTPNTSTALTTWMDGFFKYDPRFTGVKGVVLIGDKMLVYRRDSKSPVHPNELDLPGGGIKGNEAPFETFKRGLNEEFGLNLLPANIVYARQYPSQLQPGKDVYFAAAKLPAEAAANIRFGNAGSEYLLLSVEGYLARRDAWPDFQERVRDYLKFFV